MKRLISIILALVLVVGVCAEFAFAADGESIVGKEAYTRTNLKVKGSTIYFHNMSKIGKVTIPLGTAVVITGENKKFIKFRLANEKKKYKIEAPASTYNKYFVDNKATLGMQGMKQSMKDAVAEMRVEMGMTKQEVYMSRGCPAWTAYGSKAYSLSLAQIMNSNNWFYNRDKGKEEIIVHFRNNFVSDIEELK